MFSPLLTGRLQVRLSSGEPVSLVRTLSARCFTTISGLSWHSCLNWRVYRRSGSLRCRLPRSKGGTAPLQQGRIGRESPLPLSGLPVVSQVWFRRLSARGWAVVPSEVAPGASATVRVLQGVAFVGFPFPVWIIPGAALRKSRQARNITWESTQSPPSGPSTAVLGTTDLKSSARVAANNN
jgi:hypothetical protein